MCLFMCKRHLKHCYVKRVENDSRKKKKNYKTHAKKAQSYFLFPVKDIKITDIFYKIQKFLTMSWASVIAHKDLTPLNYWS